MFHNIKCYYKWIKVCRLMCHSLINKKFVIVGIFLGNRRIKHFGKCCYLENKLFCSANKSLNHSVDHFPITTNPGVFIPYILFMYYAQLIYLQSVKDVFWWSLSVRVKGDKRVCRNAVILNRTNLQITDFSFYICS